MAWYRQFFSSQFPPSPSSLPHFFSRQCLSLWSKLAWNFQQSSCPSFSSAGIIDTHRPPSPLFCRRWTHRSCTWSQLVLSSGGSFSYFPSPMGTPWIQSPYTACHILIWCWVLHVGTGSLHRPGPTSSPPLPVSLTFLKLPDRVDCPHLSGTKMEKIKNLCMVPSHKMSPGHACIS